MKSLPKGAHLCLILLTIEDISIETGTEGGIGNDWGVVIMLV